MKLQSVNVVPPSTHTVINDLTLSKALKHSGLCFGPGQSLESKPSLLFFLLLHTTQQVVIDEGRQRVAWELIENCPQICTWAKHLTCKCYSGSGCMAASERWEKTAEWKLDFALRILENRFNNKAEVFGSCGLEVFGGHSKFRMFLEEKDRTLSSVPPRQISRLCLTVITA